MEKQLKLINEIKNGISKSITGVAFISIHNHKTKRNEIANCVINVGASYERALKRDLKFLSNLDKSKIAFNSDMELIEKARIELIKELKQPKDKVDTTAFKEILPWAKVHKKTGSVIITGTLRSKAILKESSTTKIHSSPLQMAKRELRRYLKTSQLRNFTITKRNDVIVNHNKLNLKTI
jgi:hypothetical protein